MIIRFKSLLVIYVCRKRFSKTEIIYNLIFDRKFVDHTYEHNVGTYKRRLKNNLEELNDPDEIKANIKRIEKVNKKLSTD